MTALDGKLHEGASVKVKEGVRCPDYERVSLAGWQGRIASLEEGENGKPLVCIRWDSVTLAAMPADYLRNSEDEGCDFAEMYLAADDVYVVEARDSEAEAEEAASVAERRAFWLGMGPQGKRVLEVIGQVDPEDDLDAFDAWEQHMRGVLEFPFDAVVAETPDHGPLRAGDKLQILGIAGTDEIRGVLVKAKRRWRNRVVALCDIEAASQNLPQHQSLADYAVWFANR